MKLPRLPRKCSVFDAKYSENQMHEYGQKCIEEYLKQIPTLVQVPKSESKSIIEKIKESW